MADPVSVILPVVAIFTLAGLVKGVIGLGLPTVAMGLLGLLMTPAEAAAILLVPSFVTNVWQLLAGPGFGAIVRRLWPMMLAVFAGTLAAAGFIAGGNATLAVAGLGLALVAYALLGVFNVKMDVPAKAEPWLGPAVGLATGAVTGMTGVFVIPAVPYLAGLGLQRDDLVQALGLSFTVSTVALAAGLFWHGAMPASLAGTSLLAVVPALAGMWLGGWLRQRVSAQVFRRWFFVGLGLLGVHILWQAAT